MAWSVLQAASAAGTTGANTKAVTFSTANLTSGTKIIAVFGGFNAGTLAPSSVRDGASNAMTQVAFANDTTNQVFIGVYAMDTPAGDAGTKPTITVTFGAGQTPECSLLVMEVSGLVTGNTSAMWDGTAATASFAAGASHAQPSYSSTASNEFLLAAETDNGGPQTVTQPAGYTLNGSAITNNSIADAAPAYKNSTGGAESGTWTFGGTTTSTALAVVAFKVPAAAASAVPVTGPKPGIYRGRPGGRGIARGVTAPPGPSTGNGTANLTGTGVLGDVQVIQGAVAFAGGAGTLTATGSSASPGSAALTGAGVLTATGGSAPPVASIAQAGAGVFPSRPPRRGTWRRVAGTVAQTSTVTGSATITGTGALPALAVQQAVAALAGAGALTVPAVQQSGAALTGAGTLGPVLVTQQVTAALPGAGNLTAVSGAFTNGTATLTGAGTLAATGSTVTLGPAALAGAGTLTAFAVQGATAAAAGAGALAAPVTLPGMGALTGAGTLAATGSQHAPNVAAKSKAAVSDTATSLPSVTDPRDGTPGVT